MWLGLVGARLHHGTHRAPVGPDCAVGPRSGPDCTVGPRSGPDCTVGPRSGPDCAVGPRSGPDCAVGPRSGRDCVVTLSFALQSYNTASSAKPVAVRSARIRFWEGVVLLGISPEPIFFEITHAKVFPFFPEQGKAGELQKTAQRATDPTECVAAASSCDAKGNACCAQQDS